MSETTQQMEDRWLLLVSATNPKTGLRVTETDLKYARECHALRVVIEERKAAEASRPQISQTQLDQLAWLDRLQGAKDPSGRRIFDDQSLRGQKFRANVFAMQAKIHAGESLPQEMLDRTAAEIAKQHVTLPERVHAPQQAAIVGKLQSESALPRLPPASFNPTALQQPTITTFIKGSK